ncbi:MAG: hypothetical protein K0S65_1363 [Labilithrix sp.]|nr:hypothetical protein [Labilithrix sp.]
MRNVLGMIVGLGALLTTTAALAQSTDPAPAGGTAAASTEGSAQLPPPKPAATSVAVTTTTPTEAKKDDGITDHEKVVGKFGVMYFGISQQPIGGGAAANAVTRANVQTPVIGARYWLQERLGIDVGLGFNFFSSSRSVENGPTTTDTDGPAVMAFQIHGGLPLAFAYGKHYKFLLVPELNFGYATQTEAAQNVAPGAPQPADIHRYGLRFDVGARVGSEIQFGFIGIPELALQASIGLNFRRQVWGASQDAFGNTPASSSSDGQTDLGTTVQSDPWALFTNNISAIYYFP